LGNDLKTAEFARSTKVYCLLDKGQTVSKANYGFLNSSKKQTKLPILSREDAQDSEFYSLLGRIEDTIKRFRNLLTFNFGRHKFGFVGRPRDTTTTIVTNVNLLHFHMKLSH
jgi:hypothetical protein